ALNLLCRGIRPAVRHVCADICLSTLLSPSPLLRSPPSPPSPLLVVSPSPSLSLDVTLKHGPQLRRRLSSKRPQDELLGPFLLIFSNSHFVTGGEVRRTARFDVSLSYL